MKYGVKAASLSKENQAEMLNAERKKIMGTTVQSRLADTSVRRTSPITKAVEKKRKNGDEMWDELLSTPESDAFLRELSAKTHEDYRHGLTEEGGFDNSHEV